MEFRLIPIDRSSVPGHTVLPHDDFTRNAVDADGYGAARSGKRLVRLAYDVADVITGRNTVEVKVTCPLRESA